MPTLTAGQALTEPTRRDVLARYVNRLTIEHNTSRVRTITGQEPSITDAEWIATHAFYVNRDGRLSGNHRHCRPVSDLTDLFTLCNPAITHKEITS